MGDGDEDRIAARAELTAEEKAAGSDAPDRQAEAILEESERRVETRGPDPGKSVEHRTSTEATPPPDLR
jgi:hypothetical protein